MRKTIVLLLLGVFFLLPVHNAFAISIAFVHGTDDRAVQSYSSEGVGLTLRNPVDVNRNGADFAIGNQGLFFSNSGSRLVGINGDLNIDTFEFVFDTDVTINSFARFSSQGSGDVSFVITGGGGTSGSLNIGGTQGRYTTTAFSTILRVPFSAGSIPFFRANQAYTVDFTYGSGDRVISIGEVDFSRYVAPAPAGDGLGDEAVIPDAPNPVPEPGTITLLGMGLMGMAGWRRSRFSEKG